MMVRWIPRQQSMCTSHRIRNGINRTPPGKIPVINVSIGTDPATEEGYLPLFLPVDGRTAIKYNDQVYILKTSGDVEIVVNNLMTEIALSDGDRYKEKLEFMFYKF